MKQLIIARHAKSSRKDIWCSDAERTLNKRWKQDLRVMSTILKEHFHCPDLLVASPSIRTTKTARAYATAWWYKKKHIMYIPELYNASLRTLIRCIESTDEAIWSLMVVWHNPWLTDLVQYCWWNCENVPTSGVVVFEYTWVYRGDFEQKKCVYQTHFFPKELCK